MVKSVLKTFQGLTIGKTNMWDRILQPFKNNNGQTLNQGERKPFNKTPQTTPRVHDRGGQNGKMPGRDKQKDVSFKKPSDDKKGTPRANMVSEKEHIQASFFMHCESSSQEGHIKIDIMSKETLDEGENSIKNYNIEQDAELTQDSARILVMTQDECEDLGECDKTLATFREEY